MNFFLDYSKTDKKQKLSAADIVETRSKEMWLLLYVIYVIITCAMMMMMMMMIF